MKDFLLKSKIMKSLYFFIGFILIVFLTDQVVMPWYVSLGDELKMPDVLEISVQDAQTQLQRDGFNVILSDSVYDGSYAPGTVVEQMPVASSTVKVGRNVYLTVSNGEKPIVMPNLFSRSPEEAKLRIRQMGLQLNTILYSYSDLYPEGAVIGQSFPQGQKVKRNTKITITVSLGGLPNNRQIPNLIGKSLDAARQQLRQLNIAIGVIEYEKNDRFLPNTILKQQPLSGTIYDDDNPLNLTISKLPNTDH